MNQKKLMATCLLHIGSNMWRDKYAPIAADDKWNSPNSDIGWSDSLRFDREVFHHLTEELPKLGIDTVLLDIGDGVRYDSHPEIGVCDALTPDELRAEVRRLRKLGLNPVPKLNFSAAHDAWLGDYERMLATDIYRAVIGDLIHEICDIFEKPDYLHLGMDEETPSHQAAYGFSAVRGEELWWKDFYHMVAVCERENTRPWIWSDYYWHHKESFLSKMPKTVLQSNWHYYRLRGERGDEGQNGVGWTTFFDLAERGYDQVPTTTTWDFSANTEQVIWGLAQAALPHMKGFMSASWMTTQPQNYYGILEDADRLCRALKEYGAAFPHE